jgi:hypothetical protein
MCQFEFAQGLYQPVWLVNIDYRGKVRNFEKLIAKEGGMGFPDARAPKDGKLPKGARPERSK